MGYLEILSYAYYFLNAQLLSNYSNFIFINVVFLLFLLFLSYLRKKISFSAIIILLTSTYLMRMAIDLHKLKIGYIFYLILINLNLWRWLVLSFHFSWLIILLSDILSKITSSPNILKGRVPTIHIGIILAISIFVILNMESFIIKAEYYIGSIKFFDFFETIIYGIFLFIAFRQKHVLYTSLLPLFALFLEMIVF